MKNWFSFAPNMVTSNVEFELLMRTAKTNMEKENYEKQLIFLLKFESVLNNKVSLFQVQCKLFLHFLDSLFRGTIRSGLVVRLECLDTSVALSFRKKF